MESSVYFRLKQKLEESGFTQELEWAGSIKPPKNADHLFAEYLHVVCNSGMKAQIAEGIIKKIWTRILEGGNAADVFGHKGKAKAIDYVLKEKASVFECFMRQTRVDDQLRWCESLPWIGPITKYHLAKNLGVQCCKPDRHLVRIASKKGETPFELCGRLSKETGDTVPLVDSVLWRAANQGLI